MTPLPASIVRTAETTVSEPIAKPTPSAPGCEPSTLAASLAICELTPITSPSSLSSGPPELPGLSAASVWITPVILAPSGAEISRPSADTMPLVKVSSRPYGVPIAYTVSPTRTELEPASASGFRPRPDGRRGSAPDPCWLLRRQAFHRGSC